MPGGHDSTVQKPEHPELFPENLNPFDISGLLSDSEFQELVPPIPDFRQKPENWHLW